MIPLLPLAASVALWILVKATLLVGLAYGVTRCLDRAPASVRHLIWGTALLGVVVTPLLGPVVPGWCCPRDPPEQKEIAGANGQY